MRISTTDIEQYRLVVSTDWASEEELIAKLRGKPLAPSWKMEAGKAWGQIMEAKAQSDDDGRYHFGDCAFQFDDALIASRTFKPGGVHECKTVLSIDGHDIVAMVDYVLGTEISEFKCKFGSAADPKFYEQGLQWRFYLEAFAGSSVTYQLFHFADPDAQGTVRLNDISSLRFWPYRGLADDCRYWVREFVQWAEMRGLVGFLEDHQRRRAS